MPDTISTKSPYRVNFAGGFTDIPEYYNAHGGAVIESAIGTYAYALLKERNDGEIRIRQSKLGIEEDGKIGDLGGIREFYKVIIEHFSPGKGFELAMNTDTAYGSGLGSSSASLVSIIGAFNRWLNMGMDQYDIAELAHEFEMTKLKIHLGKQDPYATAFGGINYIEFNSEKIKVNRVNLPSESRKELESMLLLVNTATARPSESPLKKLAQMVVASDRRSLEHLAQMKMYAEKIRDAMRADRLEEIGPLVYSEWLHKRALQGDISSSKIDGLFKMAMDNGATGGKLLGIGGGGHIFLIVEPEKRAKVADALKKEKFEVIEPKLAAEGLTVEVKK